MNGPAKSNWSLTHGGFGFSYGWISALEGNNWYSWHELQLSTFCSIRVFIEDHQAYDLALDLMLVISGWLSCNSSKIVFCNEKGMTILFLHNKTNLLLICFYDKSKVWIALVL